MRSAITLFIGTMAAFSQSTPPAAVPEIRGTVLEGGTNVPLADAKITVSVLDNYSLKEVTKTTTDANGAFRVTMDKLDQYIVRAEKPGHTYDGKNPMRHTPSNQAQVKLDKAHLSADARLFLVRAGELTGQVVDADTGTPIANLQVYPITLLYSNGRPAQIGDKAAVTGSEGQFVATDLQPGSYLVKIRPQTLDKEQFQGNFSPDDLKVVDRDYQRSYWPGGGGFDMALPVRVLPGSSTSVGTIKARKGPF
jgi:5-hydroxyisourate hydrolase-like protein (transthyretin family)